MTAATWFKRLSLIAMLLALTVVVFGAFVRLSDAGLGCPDWPGCYGQITVPQHETAIAAAQSAFPDRPLETHKAWKEMLHRYLAGTLGLLILGLLVLGWRARKVIRVSPWLPTLVTATVVFQAMLGMWTVTLLLKPMVVSAHLIGGMTTLALLVWIAHRQWGKTIEPLPSSHTISAIRLGIVVLFIQIFLGGWTSANYAALICTDFPTCSGSLFPELDYGSAYHMFRELGMSADGSPLSETALVTIQWTHRLGALITFLYLGWLSHLLFREPKLRRIAIVLMALLVLQICLGISNVLLHLPLPIAAAHNMGAALLLITLVVMNSKITK